MITKKYNKKNTTQKSPVRWLVLSGVWMIYFNFGLSISGLAPIIELILIDLNMSHTAMGSVLGAWQLIYIISAVPCGLFVDRIGPRKALFLATLVMAGSGFARSIAFDYLSLFFAVSLFGIGGPIVSSGAPKLVALWFSGRERGFAMGVYITGPAIAGLITLTTTHPILLPFFDGDWRLVIRLWSTFTLIAGALWLIICQQTKVQAMEFKIANQSKDQKNVKVFNLLKTPAIRIMLFMAVGIFMFNHGLNNWLPELLKSSGMNSSNAGYWASIPTLIGIICSLLIPRFAIPQRRFYIFSALIISAGLASLLLIFKTGLLLLIGLIFQGIARGSLMTIAILTLVELPEVGEKKAGIASGLFFSAAEIGGVAGPLMLGSVYDMTGSFNLGLNVLTFTMSLLFMFNVILRKNSKD